MSPPRSKGRSGEDDGLRRESVPAPAAVFRAMNSASKRLPHYFDKAFGTVDLRLTEFGMLQQLSESGPTPMVRLSDENLVTKAAVTAIIDEMEAKGLVRRQRDSSDRRVVNVRMTPAGKKLFAVARRRHQEIVNAFVSVLEPDEVRALVRSFDKLAKFMDEHGV
jgi:MarR family transcriptional regulator, 2-MHQ and catechol-resistance regulon repressor